MTNKCSCNKTVSEPNPITREYVEELKSEMQRLQEKYTVAAKNLLDQELAKVTTDKEKFDLWWHSGAPKKDYDCIIRCKIELNGNKIDLFDRIDPDSAYTGCWGRGQQISINDLVYYISDHTGTAKWDRFSEEEAELFYTKLMEMNVGSFIYDW